MANYVPNELAKLSGQPSGQQPIVLARLPRVGSIQSEPTSASVPVSAPPISAPVSQAVPPPVAMPQLDLRTEIDQRTRLHIASTPTQDQAANTAHFIDRQHDSRVDSLTKPEELIPPQHKSPPQHKPSVNRPSKYKTAPKPQGVAQPIGLGEKLFQMHSKLAPHAGLIVTLALIASAGLLYWMIVGPTQAPLPNYHSPGFESQPEHYGDTPNYMPEFIQPEYTADLTPLNARKNSSNNALTKDHTPAPLPANSHGAMPKLLTPTEQPVVDTSTPTQQDTSPTHELQFPTTDKPQSLKFSLLRDASGTMPSQNALQPLPAVAKRPTAVNNQ